MCGSILVPNAIVVTEKKKTGEKSFSHCSISREERMRGKHRQERKMQEGWRVRGWERDSDGTGECSCLRGQCSVVPAQSPDRLNKLILILSFQ